MTQVNAPPFIREEPRVDRSRYWRLADLAQFLQENGFRHEIIEGELIVTAAPARPHGVVAARLVGDLNVLLKENYPSWSLMPQPINLELETDDTTFHCEPDLSIFDQPFDAVLADEELLPAIVIEIVSPGNPENDDVRKGQAYAEMGILEYWIVDPRHNTVTFLQLAGKDGKAWHERIEGSRLIAQFSVDVETLFAGIH